MRLIWSDRSWDEYVDWQNKDKKVLKKINSLLKDIKRDPCEGIGKPEPLKYELAGCWSRRITDEHRLVYEVNDFDINIITEDSGSNSRVRDLLLTVNTTSKTLRLINFSLIRLHISKLKKFKISANYYLCVV
jgi:toxin YoeB